MVIAMKEENKTKGGRQEEISFCLSTPNLTFIKLLKYFLKNIAKDW